MKKNIKFTLMTTINIKELAQRIDAAALNREAIEQLSLKQTFSEAEAYAIQAASIAERYERGEKLIGLKLGFTSKAKMEQMGVHDMIWGRLTDGMLVKDGEQITMDRFIHPRAEPEICFLVNKSIDKALSMEELKNYVEAVAPAIEVIDSRYKNFKFSLEDVIADNCSSSAFIVGDWQKPDQDISALDMTLEIDGKIVQSGSSAAILGNPWESMLAAARLAAQYGEVIPEGAYIMAGAATSAVYLEAGQKVSSQVAGLGSVSFGV